MDLPTGLIGRASLVTTLADTAAALGSGELSVLGTPRVLALAEAATVAATQGRLEPGRTTVGVRVELEHVAASGLGAEVLAEALLVEAEGRRLTFDVVVREDRASGPVVLATGRIERVAVDRDRFLGRVPGGRP